jgi:hypothetical protein
MIDNLKGELESVNTQVLFLPYTLALFGSSTIRDRWKGTYSKKKRCGKTRFRKLTNLGKSPTFCQNVGRK